MLTGFDEAFGQVKELVADFKANESFYLSPQFSEAQARKDFILEFNQHPFKMESTPVN
jgi:hypothetical protein